VGSIVLGLAPTVTVAIIGRTLVGLGVAMLFVPTMKILVEWFRVQEFAYMTGILIAMGGLGSLTAATPLVWLSNWIGWRMSFVFVGGFTLILGVLVWLLVRDKPSDFGWPAPADIGSQSMPASGLMEGVRRVLSFPWFWPLALWFFCNFAIFFSFGGLWGGPYLMHVYGLSKTQAGRILSMLAVGMVIGSPLLSYASNNLVRGRKPVVIVSSTIVLGIMTAMVFFTDRIPTAGLYLVCFALGIFSSAIVVIGFTMAKELFPVRIAGTATGLVNLFPFAGGAVFQPVLGFVLESKGRVNDAFTPEGYRSAFMVLFACAVLAFGASLFLKETLRVKEDR
jgi:sugar phosphate permease